MKRSEMSSEEVCRLGEVWYNQGIRERVETKENIGKMLIIDVETGNYEIEDTGFEAAQHFHATQADTPLYGLRIGYNVAASLGGVMERTV